MEIIQINPPNIRKVEGVLDIHPCLQPHFCSLIVGKPGSGKSHLIEELILNKKTFYKKFNKILFVGDSGYSRICPNPQNTNSVFDPEWMMQKIKENKGCKNILFVLDDVIGEIKSKQNDPLMMKLVFNRRHIVDGCTVSYLITTQKYMVCPSRLRSCLSSIYFFKVQKADFKRVIEECVFEDLTRYHYLKIVKHLVDHNFCYIRLDNSNIYLNFDPLV
jgi:hypothetical protein